MYFWELFQIESLLWYTLYRKEAIVCIYLILCPSVAHLKPQKPQTLMLKTKLRVTSFWHTTILPWTEMNGGHAYGNSAYEYDAYEKNETSSIFFSHMALNPNGGLKLNEILICCTPLDSDFPWHSVSFDHRSAATNLKPQASSKIIVYTKTESNHGTPLRFIHHNLLPGGPTSSGRICH